jgi:50S ribosomal subunit-associated GTPase HflX
VGRSASIPAGASRAVVVALVSAKATDTEQRILLVTEHLSAHGVEVVGSQIQRRGVSRSRRSGGAKHLESALKGATFIGSGKAKMLAELVETKEADLVYFMNNLSATQVVRLSAMLGCSVIASPPEATGTASSP